MLHKVGAVIVSSWAIIWTCASASLPPIHQIPISPQQDAATSASEIREILTQNEIITQVLDDFHPEWAIDLTYPSDNDKVELGNTLPVSHVQQRPRIALRPLDPHALPEQQPSQSKQHFALILTDPDATSRSNPTKAEMCHWILLANLTLSSSSSTHALHPASALLARNTDELESYLPPAPPPRTGPHRYVFVLLELGARARRDGLSVPRERAHWGYGRVRRGVRDWAGENGLRVVGANFSFAQNEEQ